MDRTGLVELIEEHLARLTPEGRELWESSERLIETSMPGDDAQPALMKNLLRARDLPEEDRVGWAVLFDLVIGLRLSGEVDRYGPRWPDALRREAVIMAARNKAKFEERTIEQDLTLRDALDQLAQPYSPTS